MADPAPADKGPDWPDRVLQLIETSVGTIHDKATVPITKVVRAVVYGLIAAACAILAIWLLCLIVVRVLVAYVPVHPESRRVYIVYAALGGIFMLLGAFFWRKRKPAST